MIVSREAPNEIKFVLTGLDNAGKSSMLIVLNKMYQFEEELKKLQPTIRIDYYKRDFLGRHINFWDFGGQSKYRERYLQRKAYFESVSQMIYLVDITDPNRIQESIQYLGQILSVLEEMGYNKNNDIYICFSKMDYNAAFSERPDFIVNLAKARSEILKQFTSFKFDFYSTSIYNVYSIVKMVSKGLMKNIPGYKEIFDELEFFAEKNDVEQIVLFDNTGLIIADCIHHLESYNSNELDKVISNNLKFFKTIQDQQIKGWKSGIRKVGDFMNACYEFNMSDPLNSTEDKIYNISIIYKDQQPIEANIDELILNLQKLIREICG